MNPSDPLVEHAQAYMYQMATMAYHTLHRHHDHRPRQAVAAEDGALYACQRVRVAEPKPASGPTGGASTRSRAAAREQFSTSTAHSP